MSQNKRYDIVVFGASGYTGQYVVEDLARVSKEDKDLTFAVAGRNQAKLEKTLITAGKYTGIDLAATPIIIADVADPKSLTDMAAQARLVINTVGPYRFYGEQVVRACVENGTDHVDVSGEPQYLESMQVKYHQPARENKVYVVGACGFDSIPCDMGCSYLIKNFKGDVNSIESYLSTKSSPSASSFGRINYGTWHSAIHGLANAHELRPIRRELFKEKFPKPAYRLKHRSVVHHSQITGDWCLPFPGSDRSIVKRSEYYRYTEEKGRPTQMTAYVSIGSLLNVFMVAMVGIMFGVMAKFKFTRGLLEKFPKIFSCGMVTTEGPDRKNFDGASFKMVFVGKGWKESLGDPNKEHESRPNKTVIAEVNGGEPGYLNTAMNIVQCALVILRERNSLPPGGGVYTPAAAFSHTKLFERLEKHGLSFKITETKEE